MHISSPIFENNNTIPRLYTCEGIGSAIPLTIAEVPKEAKSLVLIVDDPDAPMGLFTHWVVWNIQPQTTYLSSDDMPDGVVQGKTSAGRSGWVAPCPPKGSGVHRYQFHLYALSRMLELSEGATRSAVAQAITPYQLEYAVLVGLYGSSQK